MSRTDRLSRYWDRQAGQWPGPAAQAKYFAPSRRWVCQRAVGQVLEVGIGSGDSLADYPSQVALTGVDFSPAMIRLARSKAQALGRLIDLQVADAQA
ncbi:MAG: class I SAM-dependent methyltransferase, partial [Micrococcales bacterium]|nr:class I SAM-dependent methyltransferase [Micrococcales bacterium]